MNGKQSERLGELRRVEESRGEKISRNDTKQDIWDMRRRLDFQQRS